MQSKAILPKRVSCHATDHRSNSFSVIVRPLTRNDRSYSSASYRSCARNAATFSHALAIFSKVTLSSGRVTSEAKARQCFVFCLYSSTLRISPRPRPSLFGMAYFLFQPGSFRYSDAAPKELRASTSSDGDDDDGSRGDRRSNAGDVSDDGSNHSDDGSTDDDSRTKLRLELRCRLRLRR